MPHNQNHQHPQNQRPRPPQRPQPQRPQRPQRPQWPGPQRPSITDQGPKPFVININSAARQNRYFRTTLWTGKYLQATLMSISDEIGLEIHRNNDQFLKIEEGYGTVMMGSSRDNLNQQVRISKDSAIFIPAGTWHNIINRGNTPLKLYSIYAPPHHRRETVHPTRRSAELDEHDED